MVPEHLLVTDAELSGFSTGTDLASKAHGLLLHQQRSWDTLRDGYSSLQLVRTREFAFDGFVIKAQYNPRRLTSSAAKVDEKSIRERKCFLCPQHLPPAQRGFMYGSDYIVLCNPFPIFPEHFTLPHREHTPQEIMNSFGVLLDLGRDMAGRYLVTYNGPRSGASAPDHKHFQAGNRSFLPLDQEYESIKRSAGEELNANERIRVYSIERYLRSLFSFESADAMILQKAFALFYGAFQAATGSGEEPMMNIIVSYENGEWRVLLFPREKHRPSFFFEEGEKRILVSPAAVDLGGVLTMPREEDFTKITRDHIVRIYSEVTLAPAAFGFLRDLLGKSLATL